MTANSYCDVGYIRQELAHPVTEGRPPGRVGDAFEESLALGQQAFGMGDPAAWARAERALYAIHAYNAFAPPVHPTVSAVWANLIAAKVGSLVTDHVRRPALTFDEMSTMMRAAVAEADRRDHPVLDELDRHGLVVYAKNWYTSTHGFEEQLISTLHRSPHHLRQMLFHNLADELGADATPHVELRAEALRNFDVAYDVDRGGVLGGGGAFDDPDVSTEAFAVSNTRTAFSLLPDSAFSLGSFYSIEACFPSVCRRIAGVLRRRGVTDSKLYFWALHGEVDEDHSAEWLEGIKRAGLGDALHVRIANGAINHLLVRGRLFGAMAERIRR